MNRIAIVTGGSRGLGKNMALALAGKGFDVVITYHSNTTEAAAVVAAIEATGAKAASLSFDAAHPDSIPAFKRELADLLQQKFKSSSFHALINNAGTGLHKLFPDVTVDDFDQLMNIHFKSVYFLTQALLPMISDGGRIVNISSGLARFSFPGSSTYASMKGAVETFSRYLAKELGARGITVNTVAPGAIETDFNGGAVRDNAALNQQIASLTALGRVGLPDDIGGVVAFLCTDEARWITAQRVEVSGGMMV